MMLLINGKEEVFLNLLKHAAVLVAADHHFHFFQLFQDGCIFEDVHKLLVGRHTELDLQEFQDRLGFFLLSLIFFVENGFCILNESGAEDHLAGIKIADEGLEFVKLMR